MFPGRGQEGNLCDFGTLRLKAQRYDWQHTAAVLAPDEHTERRPDSRQLPCGKRSRNEPHPSTNYVQCCI